jgi:hypothetical protein
MNDTASPMTESTKKPRLANLEPYARKGLLGTIIAMVLVLIGQYTGASSVASVMQKEHMDAWASRSPAHAAAMAEYLECDRSGPELTKQACVDRAATGDMAIELDEIATTPVGAWKAMPAPLRWFLN